MGFPPTLCKVGTWDESKNYVFIRIDIYRERKQQISQATSFTKEGLCCHSVIFVLTY